MAPNAPPQVATGPLQMGTGRPSHGDPLAQAGNPTPVAGPAIRRQRAGGRNPKEDPDALAGTSGSARGAPGDRRPYRNRPCRNLRFAAPGRCAFVTPAGQGRSLRELFLPEGRTAASRYRDGRTDMHTAVST